MNFSQHHQISHRTQENSALGLNILDQFGRDKFRLQSKKYI